MSDRGKKPPAPKKKGTGYKMPPPLPSGEVISFTRGNKKWRIGSSIGVGGFGEIYSACEHDGSPKKTSSYPFVVKIEPHENGPLFVENHFYIRNGNMDDITKFMKEKKLSSLGMPTYFGIGSHEYNGGKYRYLVLERYGKDIWSLFEENGRSFPPSTVFQLGLQMLDVLEYIHSRKYVHADIKGSNILLGLKKGTENQAYLLDFGLATRVNAKEFKPEPKRAHNGTIEYTSRDAHVGVPTMRGDLEILAYNMLQWIVGELPWEKSSKQPKTVQEMKESFMKNVRSHITKQYNNVPDALIKFFEYINTLQPKEVPDYTKCKQIFESYLKNEGKTRSSKLDFTPNKNKKTKITTATVQNITKSSESENEDETDIATKVKVTRRNRSNGHITIKKTKKVKTKQSNPDIENGENEEPAHSSSNKVVKRNAKRKSIEPALVVKVKKTKMAPKSTPPAKKKHTNIATQTSFDKPKRDSPIHVSFDSPVSEVMGKKKLSKTKAEESANSSGDIFEDSFVIKDKKIKPKKRLISDEEVIVKRVVKKKVTAVKSKHSSWKDTPTIVNGRSPRK